MSNKPSLYVVEKKEVVVLVLLFVLVTVLAFTLGVKYGESIGRKAFSQDHRSQHELEEELAGRGGSGTLSDGAKSPHTATPEAPAAASAGHESTEHAAESTPETAAAHGAGHGDAHKAEPSSGHGAAEHGAPHGAEHAADSPEAAAGHKEEPAKMGLKDRPKEPIDTNSDQHLLEALTQAGIEPAKQMGAKANKKAEPNAAGSLPDEAKALPAGAFTIQVGSYPTKGDADQQIKRLRAEHVSATILAPVSDKSGEWFRVVVGSYMTKADAERAAKLQKEKGTIKSYFVRKLN